MTTSLPAARTPRAFLSDLAERVGSTFALVLLSNLVASGLGRYQWGTILLIAAFAAFGSFLTTLLVWMGAIKTIANPYADLAYRSAVTFVQTLGGLVAAAGAISGLDFGWKIALQTSLIAAGVSALKALTGLSNPDTAGASVFVKSSGSLNTVSDDGSFPAGFHPDDEPEYATYVDFPPASDSDKRAEDDWSREQGHPV